MRLLLIDDQPDTIEGLVEALTELGDVPWVCDFGDVPRMMREFRPDLIVLDVKDSEDENAGVRTFLDEIYPEHFCPAVIYSAAAEEAAAEIGENPLVRCVMKSGASEPQVLECLDQLRPHAARIAATRQELDTTASVTLRVLLETIAATDIGDVPTLALMETMGRRRLAAYLDDPENPQVQLPENQYVYPPVGPDYRFGDLLQESGAAFGPASFRLVLTPSCDLVSHNGQAKAKSVLLAGCKDVPWADLQAGNPPFLDEKRKRVVALLNDGFAKGMVFLPSLMTIIPAMCADFRMLELHPYVADEDGALGIDGFDRIAAVDSPFRERIGWAFMSTSCRPGVPALDIERWIQMYEA